MYTHALVYIPKGLRAPPPQGVMQENEKKQCILSACTRFALVVLLRLCFVQGTHDPLGGIISAILGKYSYTMH